MKLDKENTKKIIGIIAIAVLFYTISQHLSYVVHFLGICWKIIFPLVIGFAIAFILNIPMRFFEKHLFKKHPEKRKLRRISAFLLTVISVLGVLALAVYIVIPELVRTVSSLVIQVPKAANNVSDYFSNNSFWNDIYKEIQGMDIDLGKMVSSIGSNVQKGLSSVLSSTTSIIGTTINSVASFFMGLVFAVYVLLQKDKLMVQGKQILYAFIPVEKVDALLDIFRLTQKSFSNFFSGQCLEAMILGTLFFIAMNIFRMPYSLLISVLIAITALIPVFGAFIGCFVGALLILMVNPMQAIWFVVLFLVLQQIEGNLIYPHVVGNAVGLPSIWVFVAVVLGGKIMGIFGMLLFIPLGSVCYTLLRACIYDKLNKRHIPQEKYGTYEDLFEHETEPAAGSNAAPPMEQAESDLEDDKPES